MATRIPGYHGQLLDIDLTSRKVKAVDLDPTLARGYLGGRAMGGRMLLDAYGTDWAKVDPFDPDALLLFLAAPFVCFLGCKTNVVFKSPQSFGFVGAQGSGDFIHELRFCGYDGIILRGRASAPVYLTIFDDEVEFHDASKMWGKEIAETHKMVVEAHGNETSQYYIGPAGENLVRYAAVITEWYRAAGRGGGGAVMGSKNLKAIVCKGNGPAPEVADQQKLVELMIAAWALQVTRQGSREYGTTGGILRTGNVSSTEPIRNWQTEWHDHYEVAAQYFAAEHWVRRYWSDYGCAEACSKLGRVKYGKRAGLATELPDYEGGALIGTNFGIFDINDMALTCSRPDELGLDLISAGNVCSFACEAVEKGILTPADIGGIDLKWGDADAFVELLDLIAYRKGEIPTLLGEGLHVAVKTIGKGSGAFAMHVKAIEMGAHGRRARPGGEIGYAVGSQGGDHMSTVSPTGESAIFRDSNGLCGSQSLTADQQIEWLQAITGFGITKDDVQKILVPRWMTLHRVPLLLSGWTYEDDVNPPRWYTPLPDGPYRGNTIDRASEQKQKQALYELVGWDAQGVPTTATLRACDLEAFDELLAPLRARQT
jgi:aldehyde:ferredoxin oxidoreductase